MFQWLHVIILKCKEKLLAWIGDVYTEKRKCQEYVKLNWGMKMEQTNN